MTEARPNATQDDAGTDASTRQRLEVIATAFTTALETLPEDLGLSLLGAEFAATWRARVRDDLQRVRTIIANSDNADNS
ncbi:hypothetical protein ACQPW1_10775 [Nocardia sp. CA-128927]|uniref:hypothetical protein n=1 Tax=Nocardia sp. CA-128927 TaxID=3239975 RepID=UPI003D965A1D